MKESKYLFDILYNFLGINVELDKNISSLNLEKILYQATLHRITPVIYHYFFNENITSKINNNIYKLLKTQYDISSYRDRMLSNEAHEICRYAKKTDVDAMILKGPILSNYLYNQQGLRMYGDIDILMNREDLSKGKKLISSLGYMQANKNKDTDLLIEATRFDILKKEISSHETVEFYKNGQVNLLDEIIVDINHSVLWKKTTQINLFDDISTNTFLDNNFDYKFEGKKIVGPTPELLFIHTCLHLYSEAVLFCWQYSWHKNWGDIEMIKYLDIGLLMNKEIDWDIVNSYIEDKDFRVGIEFVISNFNILFPIFPIPKLLKKYVNSESKVNYYYTCKGEIKHWNNSLKDRVFNQNIRLEDVLNNTKKGDLLKKNE
nr:nucleotidyltransferase family protein [Enterococcus rivorum]